MSLQAEAGRSSQDFTLFVPPGDREGGPERPYSGPLALYGSFFEHDGIRCWWYPEAMRFLLGRVVPDDLVA